MTTITPAQCIKLGAGLGIAWGLILAGCLTNVSNTRNAITLAAVVFAAVIAVMMLLPGVIRDLQEKADEESDEFNPPP